MTKWMLITFSIYNQFYSPGYLGFKCFQNVFCKTAKTKEMNFRKLGHDWFNKETWQDSIQCISVTARFERSTKVAYFQQLRGVSPIALQFTSGKSYAESLRLQEVLKNDYSNIYIFNESFFMFITWFSAFLLFPNSGIYSSGAALCACLWEMWMPL